MLSCLPPHLWQHTPKRHSTDEVSLWGQTRSQEVIKDEPSKCDTRNASVVDAAQPPTPEPSFVPTTAITHW